MGHVYKHEDGLRLGLLKSRTLSNRQDGKGKQKEAKETICISDSAASFSEREIHKFRSRFPFSVFLFSLLVSLPSSPLFVYLIESKTCSKSKSVLIRYNL